MKYVLYFNISTSRSMCAVPNMAVFCSYFISWFPGISLMYCLSDFEMVPVAPLITGITLPSHSTCPELLYWGPYILISSRLISWWLFCLQELQRLLICMFLCLSSLFLVSGLLLGIVLSVRICWFNNMVTLPSWLVSYEFWHMVIPVFVVLLLFFFLPSHAFSPQCFSPLH